MSRLNRTLGLLLGLLLLAPGLQSCRFFKAEATFSIRVTDGAGEPIPGAQISIQKQLAGQTNDRGQATISLELPVDEAALVEINKPSSQLFYAPYFETVRISKGELNHFKLQATLYAVPKNVPEPPTPAAETLETKTAEAEPQPESAQPTDVALPSEDPGLISALQTVNGENPGTFPHEMEPFDPELSAQKAANTLLENAEQSSRLITFYTASGRENVSDAHILYGDPERGQWLDGCSTNARGRCSLTLPASFATDNVHILVRALGFQPQTKIISLAHGDKVRIDLIRGQAMEVFALQKSYKAIRGLHDVSIKIGDRELGRTDSFGYFAHNFAQKPADGTAITLEASGQLPARASQVLSSNGPWTIVQGFSSRTPARARLLLLPLRIQNSGSETPDAGAITSWDKVIQEGIRQNLINQPPFIEADWERVSQVLDRNGLSLQQIGRQGWNQPDLVAEFEWALRPTLILGPASSLELSLINADGRVIAASLQRLTARPDSKVMRAMFHQASLELSNWLPFEGSLVDAEKDGFRINLSQQTGHTLKVGETLRLHGLQDDAAGSQPGWSDIGSAQITGLSEGFSRVRITELKPRATASVGQIVALQRQPEGGDKYITITDVADKRPLAQVNLYLQDRWIGTTDRQGIARLSRFAASRRGVLTAVRTGYRLHQGDFIWTEGQDKAIALQRSSIPIRIETDPSNAQIKLNGRLIGRSPLYQSIDIPGPTAQIEITLNEEYKPINQVVSFDEEGLDWSGPRAVHLEKDLRREARLLIQAGRLNEAINLLDALPQSHPDYLLVQHELGDIHLNQSQDPIRAAAAFHRVTSRPEVANFVDKRFIGTHINEAIAIYHIGEKLKETDQAAAISSWKKTRDILDLCENQLRFIPDEQYTQAVHSLSYYRALSLHRIWGLTQRGEDLKNAHESWKKYIESTALATPADKHYSLLKKAEVFYRQTQGLSEPTGQAQTNKASPTTAM
ncbi:PEGA domain-containing protein [Oligoflexus tunisiensis]|uniref:PEGA domain-containing protein n=1 Tax=Oligoflexus tunisiensis TaxID=708132 RepID=UPI000A6B17CF|nr:PEGA domain-containing protein [Oligoflexus tunisiensis]